MIYAVTVALTSVSNMCRLQPLKEGLIPVNVSGCGRCRRCRYKLSL